MRCDRCEMLSINGVPCHETGCPNSRKRFCYGQWIAVYECRECGEEVEEGTVCACVETSDEYIEEQQALDRPAPSWMQRTDE